MGARIDLSVTLSPEDETGQLQVAYDHGASPDAVVDFVAGSAGRLFSCSLDAAEEFAALLSEFVQHHRDRLPAADCRECPNAEPGIGCAACGKPVVSS